MATLSIQFHALPSELAPRVRNWVVELNVHLVCISFRPFSVVEIPPSAIESAINAGKCRRFTLTVNPPNLSVDSPDAFGRENPGALTLDVGCLSANGLQESWLAARTLETPLPTQWNYVAKDLRAITNAGAIAVNPRSGATSRSKNHRYSPGAKALEASGVAIRSGAGTSLLKFGSATEPE